MTLTTHHQFLKDATQFKAELQTALDEMAAERYERKLHKQIRIQRNLFTWNKIWSTIPYDDR
jgi:hypothetical protein